MKRRTFRALLAAVMVIMLFVSMGTAAFGLEVAQDPSDARSGILMVALYLVDPDLELEYRVFSGSGFLVNESTVITCYHVAHLDFGYLESDPDVSSEVLDALYELVNERYGSISEFNRHLEVRVYYQADLYRVGTPGRESAAMDFTILSLDRPISNRKCLSLEMDGVVDMEDVYALGFPYTVSQVEDFTSTTYMDSDVTLNAGKVSKASTVIQGVSYVQHSANITEGNSGGPLVNSAGAVVGINNITDYLTASYGWAVEISQVINELDASNIQYESHHQHASAAPAVPAPVEETAGEETAAEETPGPDTTALQGLIARAAAVDGSEYTSESYTAVQAALSEARIASVSGDQQAVNDAASKLSTALDGLKPASRFNMLYIIIAAVVVLIIVIVVIVVVLLKKRPGEAPAPLSSTTGSYQAPSYQAPGYQAPGGAASAGVMPSAASSLGSTVPQPAAAAAPGTTVLKDRGTTVLKKPPYATLTSTATGEKTSISGEDFSIGSDQRRVDFLISKNSAISRLHARIINDGKKIELIDQGSTNGTFVNGIKSPARTSTTLKDGDKILFADEEYVFHLLDNGAPANPSSDE